MLIHDRVQAFKVALKELGEMAKESIQREVNGPPELARLEMARRQEIRTAQGILLDLIERLK